MLIDQGIVCTYALDRDLTDLPASAVSCPASAAACNWTIATRPSPSLPRRFTPYVLEYWN